MGLGVSKHHDVKVVELLATTPVSKILPDREIVVLHGETTVGEGLETLRTERVLSAPVIGNDCVLGLVDVLDILCHALSVCPDPSTLSKEDSFTMGIRSYGFASRTLADIIGHSGRNPFVPIPARSSVLELAQGLSSGLYRMAATDSAGDVLNIVSQTSIVRFIADNMSCLGPLRNRSLVSLGLAYKQVQGISRDTDTIKALKQLNDDQLSALAVIDPDTGALMGTFSGSDLKGLTLDNFPSLIMTVWKFLEISSVRRKPLVVKPTSKLSQVIKIIARTGVHRLWVVDKRNVPMGVVSLTDLLRVFIEPDHFLSKKQRDGEMHRSTAGPVVKDESGIPVQIAVESAKRETESSGRSVRSSISSTSKPNVSGQASGLKPELTPDLLAQGAPSA